MENTQSKKVKNPLVGSQAQPTTLDSTTKIDIDVTKALIDDIIEAGINGGLDTHAIESFTSLSNSREQIYQVIDNMAADSSVAAVIKIIAEEATEMNDQGHIIWCESQDSKISLFVNYLLNVMNADKNIYSWVYNLIKYGDVYLRLYRESDYEDKVFKKDNINNTLTARTSLNESIDNSLDEAVNLNIHKASDKYSHYIEMVNDPTTMYELVKFGRTYGYIETPNEENRLDSLSASFGVTENNVYGNFRMKSSDVNIYQADDYVHACLEDNFTRFPEKVELFVTEDDYKNNTNSQAYTVRRGKSMLIDAYKIWREKSLLENSILLNRITKSSIVRNIQVEVGDMPKTQVQQTLRRIKELFEQKSALNVGKSMSEYTSPGPIENNIFTATHNGQGAITVNAIGGDIDVKNLADLDAWIVKFYAAFGIPKAYLGYTDDGAGFNGGTSLAIISSVFAKGVKRVQNAIIQALTDAINLFLIDKGCKAYLNNFVLKMKAPITQEEIDYRTDLTNRISAISNMQSLFSDIEDKARRLEILKELIGTLDYGDGIIQIIQEEINALEAKAAKEAEETENETNEDSSDSEPAEFEEVEVEESESLGNSSEVAMESIEEESNQIRLTEEQEIFNESEFLEESDFLPSPQDLDENKDFTKNN